ncbi:MAG: FAD-dependent monooxygenase [Betaproteobacteria bacterium]
MPDDPALAPAIAPTRINTAVTGGTYPLPVYPFVEPAELAGQLGRHAVVVIGAGLAGLAAGADFSVRGIPAVVFDEDNTVGVRGASSRCICYERRSLQFFRRVGVYQRGAAEGVPWSVSRAFFGDREVECAALPHLPGAPQPAFINLQQFYVEWFLVDRIYELGIVDLRWKTRVSGVTPPADHVEVHVSTPAGQCTLQADWLIDCSGGRSAVPGRVGVDSQGASLLDRWCIADVRLGEGVSSPTERRAWLQAPFNAGHAVWMLPMADRVWRFDYQLPQGADAEAESHPQRVHARLRAQFGAELPYELVWLGAYISRSQCLAHFRAGRVFFAGDAAHVMSPFGARGGNAGVQDVENLVWKLALVLQGRAPEALLDSYEAERHPAAQQGIRAREATAQLLTPRPGGEVDAQARALLDPALLVTPALYAQSPLAHDGNWRGVHNAMLQLPDGRAADLVALPQHLDHAIADIMRGKLPTALAVRCAVLLPERYPVRFVQLGRGGELGALPPLVDAQALLEAQLGCVDEVSQVVFLRPDLYCAAPVAATQLQPVERTLRRLLGLGED